MANQPQNIKFYLKAKTAEGLKTLMLNNNIKKSSYHNYQIVYAEGFWWAWYEGDAEDLIKERVKKLDSIQ